MILTSWLQLLTFKQNEFLEVSFLFQRVLDFQILPAFSFILKPTFEYLGFIVLKE